MNYLDEINSALKEYLPAADDVVSQAMRYSVENGGKRIRPALLLEFCRVCGGDYKKAVPFACALEMIHTYSLIHDDLPCMDNDDFRRGKPSCHIAFGEEYALLAGDALLTLAFETAMKSNLSAEITVKAAKELAKAAGVMGMVGGQVLDLQNEGKKVGVSDLQKTDELKTGELIRAACVLGCVCAGADDKKIAAAEKYAHDIGIAFQIVDDILDVTSDEETLGKPIGSDEENQKSTYVSLLGIEKSRKTAEELTLNAQKALDAFDGDVTSLKDFAEKLKNRKN
ncbi:MAG: farnesyl diphosphate synthase [Oscillospiraceae bacterium]|nr:polyprenyl synthetase family protein [Ruminococcus sp.]MDY6060395.1 farnesyl diphosphate synthase [Oscillospiraceae bacterium]